MKQYRIREVLSPNKVFYPEYTEDNGTTWKSVSATACLSKEAAEQAISQFANRESKNINEIIHPYKPNNLQFLGD